MSRHELPAVKTCRRLLVNANKYSIWSVGSIIVCNQGLGCAAFPFLCVFAPLPLCYRQQPIVGYVNDGYDGYPAGQQGGAHLYTPAAMQPPPQQQYRQQPTGARLKVTRCVQLKAPDSKRALLDFGVGVGVDLDRQVRSGQIRGNNRSVCAVSGEQAQHKWFF